MRHVSNLVSRAAKKATVLLHPDRNPDDPNAASRFADFQAVCQVFDSEEARKEFDETGNVEEIKDLRQRLNGLTLEK
jgi:DnaJ-class molecular chaperone